MRSIKRITVILLLVFSMSYSEVLQITVNQCYSVGKLEFSNLAVDVGEKMDIINFSNGVNLFTIRVGGITTSSSKGFGVFFCGFDTLSAFHGYDKDSIIEVKEDSILIEPMHHFRSSISSDSNWNNALLFSNSELEKFDLLVDKKWYPNSKDTVSAFPFAFLEFNIEHDYEREGQTEGASTIFYASSKTTPSKMKFQITDISFEYPNCNYTLRWACDSLGNGIFKPDESALIPSLQTRNMYGHVKAIITGNSISFNSSFAKGAQFSLISLSGRELYSAIVNGSTVKLPTSIGNGVHLYTVREAGREYRGSVVVK